MIDEKKADTSKLFTKQPPGGYTLSIMTNAVQAFMRLPTNAKPEHFDPIHISATYYRQVAQEELRVDIKADKRGRGFSNITAELKQKVSGPRGYFLLFRRILTSH